jgi:hypothetical protein
MSEYRWSRDKELRIWLESCRLNVYRGMNSLAKVDPETARFLQRSRDSAMAATLKLQQFAAAGAAG